MRHKVLGALRTKKNQLVAQIVSGLGGRLEKTVADLVRTEIDRAIQSVYDVEFRARRDLLAAGERDAARAAARFVNRVMPTARAFHDPESTLRHGLAIAPAEGMALEFGVFEGRSLQIIADARMGVEVYGFDSFKGLPEDYRSHVRAGAFAVAEIPNVTGAQLVVGWFDETLPGFLAEHPGPVAFLHVDGDLYLSARTVLSLVGPQLRRGSVIVFDEFFNYPGWERHEFRAWQEYLATSGIGVTYEAYTSNNEQVVVRVTEPEPGCTTQVPRQQP
jgi:methyltransferase family protein